MTTITLTDTDALLASKAALANCSKDDITPVICGAHFSVVGGRLQILATDRYTVSRHRIRAQQVTKEGRLAPVDLSDDFAVIVPREALAWLAKNARAFHRHTFGGKVTFDLHPEEPAAPAKVKSTAGHVTITVAPVVGRHEALSATFLLWAGNFPPAGRLIDEAKPAEVGVLSLSPQHLAKLNTYVPADMAARFEFTKPGGPNKPGPIKITVADLDLEALLQPNLLLR